MFRSSVVKYDILSNNRRSKRHAVIECLFFKMPLLSGGLYFRRGVGGALLSGFYRRAKKLTLLSGWGVGDGALRSVFAPAHSEAHRNI